MSDEISDGAASLLEAQKQAGHTIADATATEGIEINHLPFLVTRNRRADAPQLPHPDAYDEWLDGKPTGRMQITRGSMKFTGTLEQVDEWLKGAGMSVAAQARDMRRQINSGAIHQPHVPHEPQAIWHSGLKRNLPEEERLRRCIEKSQQAGELTDKELRFLIQYYGIMIRMCEMSGQRYYLCRQDAMSEHTRLLAIASGRGWTQAIINMYGTIVEGIFEKIL